MYNPSKDPLIGLNKEEKDDFAYKYMKLWVESEGFTDFQIMYDSGDVELYADALVSAGAIDSKRCFKTCAAIERRIEKWAKTFRSLPQDTQDKRLEDAFKGTIVVSCESCNHVQFPLSCDYQMYEDELKKSCWDCNSNNIKIRPWKQ